MSAKYVVEQDVVDVGAMNDDEEFEIDSTMKFVVVNEECATAGWDQDDVVCRTHEKKEADRIAELLSEYGLSKS